MTPGLQPRGIQKRPPVARTERRNGEACQACARQPATLCRKRTGVPAQRPHFQRFFRLGAAFGLGPCTP